MNIKKEYIASILLYVLVTLYIIFIGNTTMTVILILGLLMYHLIQHTALERNFSFDKETSLSNIQNRLEKTKNEQKEISKQFLSLTTSFGSGLLLIDEDGIITQSNKEVVDYFGKDLNNLHYEKIAEYKGLYKFVNQAFLLEKSLRNQIIYKKRYFDLISTPIFSKSMFKGSIILIHDITLLKNAEKYQKRFTADVSHELRTPLSAIKGFSEILSRDEAIDPIDQKEFIMHIKTESERMEVILSDLLIISKMDRLDYELELSNIDIEVLISEAVSLLRKQFEEKKLGIISTISSQELHIDKYKISQVILNILKNALNYTDKGHIEITGVVENDLYVIKIADTGIGIANKNYENIFKRFYRVDKDRSRETGGSGLGLSISKNVLLKHGGTIQVDSELNKGTTFTIKLPIKK